MLTFKLHRDKAGPVLPLAPLRACDQCRRRRLKCDRGKPCACCKRAMMECSYVTVPKQRGRRRRVRSLEGSSASPPTSDTGSNNASTYVSAPDHGDGMPSPHQLQSIDDTSVGDLTDFQLDDSVGWLNLPPMAGSSAEWVNTIESPQTSTHHESLIDEASGVIGSHQDRLVDVSLGGGPSAPSNLPLQSESCECVLGSKAAAHLPLTSFIPFVNIFFERLYAVFPVIDETSVTEYLQSDDSSQPLPAGFYSFLAILSAAVIVQLNINVAEILQLPSETPEDLTCTPLQTPSAQFFVDQCLQTRQAQGFIEDANEWTVLTSFFLFAYYGNLDRSRLAWYYLRESIGFAQALELDEPESYIDLDLSTRQRRRRLFWLLFVSERSAFSFPRAYSLQHRRKPTLRPTIDLPRVFDSECPKLIFGFVTLAKVFSAIDEGFMTAWVDQTGQDDNNGPLGPSQLMSKMLDHSCITGTVSPSEIDEVQRLDIIVTQEWLRVLTCQLNVRRWSTHSLGTMCRATYGNLSQYVEQSSRNLLHTITAANRECLEAHGIGMEQKISDVATCLCDVLLSVDINDLSTDFFSATDFLHHFMLFLAGFRNHESQYLEPLTRKAGFVLSSRINPRQSPGTSGEVNGRGQTSIYDDQDHSHRRELEDT
ncbi:unnamed protein product [Clonostachys rosea]|uniref:Zn(2)-C6 fungal-type domain-containing protein n=1 Tax=Bionectria ochroleuca TaxID=29856 RepID=A0ABY6UFQ4_BIOOC|nr:unnamed protein product [Clonostachys rosea]